MNRGDLKAAVYLQCKIEILMFLMLKKITLDGHFLLIRRR